MFIPMDLHSGKYKNKYIFLVFTEYRIVFKKVDSLFFFYLHISHKIYNLMNLLWFNILNNLLSSKIKYTYNWIIIKVRLNRFSKTIRIFKGSCN